MVGCTKGPQLEEDKNLITRARGIRRTLSGETSALLDNRGQEKVTPRKIFNKDSGGARSENSQMNPSAEEIGGYSFDGPSRSRSRGRPRSAQKHQKSVLRKKGISKSYRPVRSEARSRSKSKSVKSKPQSVRASQRNSSSDSGPKECRWVEESSNKFLEEFSEQKMYDKDPTKIHDIKRKPNEGLQVFIDRFKAKSAHIKRVPLVLRISAFMHGYGHPKLAKKLNDRIPKTFDEMWERARLSSGERRLHTPP
nr:reverse transcriptase domain-containing protein [Tanacetum cinerariifolium]